MTPVTPGPRGPGASSAPGGGVGGPSQGRCQALSRSSSSAQRLRGGRGRRGSSRQRREDGSRTQPGPLRVLHPRPGLPGRGWALTGPNKAPSGPGSGERVGIPRHPSPCAHRGSCGQARLAPRLSQTTEGAKSQGCRPSQDPPRRETGFRPQGCRQPKGLLDSEKRINHLGVL